MGFTVRIWYYWSPRTRALFGQWNGYPRLLPAALTYYASTVQASNVVSPFVFLEHSKASLVA